MIRVSPARRTSPSRSIDAASGRRLHLAPNAPHPPELLEASHPASPPAPPQPPGQPVLPGPFLVRLDNFEGPFDLLLTLIGRRQLDVTEIALSQVTDEFLSYIAGGPDWDLGRTTEFLVVASTLLDLKAARLLPAAEVEDEEDIARLEARDLLFARLLQYRAYKLSAAHLAELLLRNARRYAREADLEPRLAALVPEVTLGIDSHRLAELAAAALQPRPVVRVETEHVHVTRVSVREHMAVLAERLRGGGSVTFRALVADCAATLEVVARFLGLLELYRDGQVAFEQAAALGDLRVRWTGPAVGGSAGDDGAAAEAFVAVDEEYG
ncbi:MAG: segregation/condensation protein A [Actinomycetota bacterium]|nr:segregation/condensation protein A [Actinomycetota bacterium]